MRLLFTSLALLLGLAACGGGDDEGSDVEGSVSADCDDYAREKSHDAELNDPYVEGIVEVGFNRGPDSREAATILRALGTAYILPLPFRDMAVLCVEPGYEDFWITKLKQEDWVEWVHHRGVNPFDTLDD